MWQSVIVGSSAVLRWQAQDQDGEQADPGVTTVTVTASDGTTVAASAVSEDGAARVASITPERVDRLTATWTGETASGVTTIDVVGGVLFTVAELRQFEPSVSDPSAYPADMVRAARRVVESIFEKAVGFAFVPRFQRVPPGALLPATTTETLWTDTDGARGVVAGLAVLPADVKRAAMLAARHYLTSMSSLLDMRVMAVNNPDGSMARLATPGVSGFITGLPEVDEVLRRYRRRSSPRSIVVKWAGA